MKSARIVYMYGAAPHRYAVVDVTDFGFGYSVERELNGAFVTVRKRISSIEEARALARNLAGV